MIDGVPAFRRICEAIAAAQHSVFVTVAFIWPAADCLQRALRARCEDEVLILEFQKQDSLMGLLKSKVKTIQLPRQALAAVDFQHKFFTACVTLRVHSMRLVQGLPGNSQGEVRLYVARKHRKVAHAFVIELELRRAEQQLRRLDDEAMQQLEQQVRRLDKEALKQLELPKDEGSD